jgi:hypothetical protein
LPSSFAEKATAYGFVLVTSDVGFDIISIPLKTNFEERNVYWQKDPFFALYFKEYVSPSFKLLIGDNKHSAEKAFVEKVCKTNTARHTFINLDDPNESVNIKFFKRLALY